MEVPPTMTNLQASRGDKVRFTPDMRKGAIMATIIAIFFIDSGNFMADIPLFPMSK